MNEKKKIALHKHLVRCALQQADYATALDGIRAAIDFANDCGEEEARELLREKLKEWDLPSDWLDQLNRGEHDE